MTTDTVFDVAVVGAGPAGSATALWLARRGWRVGLLERTRFDAARIGESLVPNVQEPLRELGAWSEFLALKPVPSWGTCSSWGDPTQQSHSHLVNPYGCGWHVDRLAFDHMLARAAVSAGACLVEGVTLKHCAYREGSWHLQAPSSSEQLSAVGQTFRARMLIDATGRRAQVARSLGAERCLLDHLVGVAVQWVGIDSSQRGHLLVESAPEGWWYSAPLPGDAHDSGGRMIAMLMTDADLCGRFRLSTAERWQAVLHASRATRQRLGAAYATSTPHVHCALSQRLRRDGAYNEGPWLAVGDATLAVDPVSGSGVLRALRTARAAADTVSDLLARPHDRRAALTAYEAERDKECTKYLFERAHYYASEQRFSTPFWQRRQVMRRLPNEMTSRPPAMAGAGV